MTCAVAHEYNTIMKGSWTISEKELSLLSLNIWYMHILDMTEFGAFNIIL